MSTRQQTASFYGDCLLGLALVAGLAALVTVDHEAWLAVALGSAVAFVALYAVWRRI